MRRFTRLTTCFSKKFENRVRMVALNAVWHNFVRVHKTLHITPAMAAGVTDSLWSIEDIAAPVEAAAPKPESRGRTGSGRSVTGMRRMKWMLIVVVFGLSPVKTNLLFGSLDEGFSLKMPCAARTLMPTMRGRRGRRRARLSRAIPKAIPTFSSALDWRAQARASHTPLCRKFQTETLPVPAIIDIPAKTTTCAARCVARMVT